MQEQINYDIFWKLSEFLEIKSIHNLSHTCKKLKSFKNEMKLCLTRRMFPEVTVPTVLDQFKHQPWIILYKMFNCIIKQKCFFIEQQCPFSFVNRIVIFILNESNKITQVMQIAQKKQITQVTQKTQTTQKIQKCMNFMMKCIIDELYDNLNLDYILIHGNKYHKKILIDKIFKMFNSITICNFNLQHLFNAILYLHNIDYLYEFKLNFQKAQIMITKNHVQKIIKSKNIIFFDKLVKLFIGDLINLNFYQSCIKEYTNTNDDSNSPFLQYIKVTE